MDSASDSDIWMTGDQVRERGKAFRGFVKSAWPLSPTKASRRHLEMYAQGLISDLPRRSVEPMALSAATMVKLQVAYLPDGRETTLGEAIGYDRLASHVPRVGAKTCLGTSQTGSARNTSLY